MGPNDNIAIQTLRDCPNYDDQTSRGKLTEVDLDDVINSLQKEEEYPTKSLDMNLMDDLMDRISR